MTTTPTYRDELADVAETADNARDPYSVSEYEAIAEAVAARVLADAVDILRAHLWGIAASELREAFRARGIETGDTA